MRTRMTVRMALALGAALLILSSTAGCWANLFPLRDRDATAAGRIATRTRLATATLFPTATPSSTPVPPTATLRPTLAPTATPVVWPTALPTQPPAAQPTPVPPTAPDVAPRIPSTPNTAFDVVLSEAQLNEYVAGQLLSQDGVEISEPQITLGDGEALVHAIAYHEASDLRMGLTLRGRLAVFEGALYVSVAEVTLDDSVRGFTRLLAKTLIDAAIAGYSGEHGLAVPIDQVVFESVTVTPGSVRIVGRTR